MQSFRRNEFNIRKRLSITFLYLILLKYKYDWWTGCNFAQYTNKCFILESVQLLNAISIRFIKSLKKFISSLAVANPIGWKKNWNSCFGNQPYNEIDFLEILRSCARYQEHVNFTNGDDIIFFLILIDMYEVVTHVTMQT